MTAKTFQCRPSSLLDAADPYAAYCVDVAVGKFGRAVEHAVAEVKGKGKALEAKREQELRKWLDMPMNYAGPKKGESS